MEGGGGQQSTMVSILASNPAAPGLIATIPEIFSEEKIVNIA